MVAQRHVLLIRANDAPPQFKINLTYLMDCLNVFCQSLNSMVPLEMSYSAGGSLELLCVRICTSSIHAFIEWGTRGGARRLKDVNHETCCSIQTMDGIFIASVIWSIVEQNLLNHLMRLFDEADRMTDIEFVDSGTCKAILTVRSSVLH